MDGVDDTRVCVLVVDDHADSRLLTAKLLRRMGFEVAEAGDLATARRQAAALACRCRVLVLVCDLELPDGDGCSLLAELRAAGLGVPLAGVAVTGHSGPEHEARCRAAGYARHLVKPVRWVDLERAVRELTGGGTAAGAEALSA